MNMPHTLHYLLLYTSLLALLGCQAHVQQEQAQLVTRASHQDAESLLKQAQSAQQQWQNNGNQNNGDNHALRHTYRLLEQAYGLRRDNINVQYAYYTSAFALAASGIELTRGDIKNLYNELHPVVQIAVPSPIRLDYMEMTQNEAANEARAELLAKGIRQAPHDPYLWSHYANVLYDQRHYYLAAAAAEQAHRIDQDNSVYLYQISHALDALSQRNNCTYDEQALTRKAVKYANEASKKASDNSHYISQVSYLYFKLGLVPLAYDRAQKSYSLEKNQWSARQRASTSILMAKYDEAEEAANYLLNTQRDPWAWLYFAQISIAQGQWAEASRYLLRLHEQQTLDFYGRLIALWITALSDNNHQVNTHALTPPTDWAAAILGYLNSSDTAPQHLLDKARSRCEKTEAHFYIAFRFWQEGRQEEVKKHLKLATRQGAAPYLEHGIATVLLRAISSEAIPSESL